MSKRAIWQFLAATLVITIVGVVLVLGCLRGSFDGTDSSKLHCEKMIVALQRDADPDALRGVAKDLVNKYPTGAAHRLGTDEQPQEVRRVMESLGLGEAVICDDVMFGQRILALAAPGGFASYGVKVVPPGTPITHTTNVSGMTELKWKDGIYVFYFVQRTI